MQKQPLYLAVFPLLVLVAAADAAAQALPNLALVRVTYNSRKATVKPDGELKVQLDLIDKEIAAASRLGRFGDVRRLYAKGMGLLSGKPWTDVDEFGASLTLRTDRLIVDSSHPYLVRLEQIFAPSIELTRSLSARATLRARATPAAVGAPAGAAAPTPTPVTIPVGEFNGVGRDLRESPFPMELGLGAVPDGSYTLAVEVADGDRVLGNATLAIEVQQDLESRLRALETAAARAPADVQPDLRYPSEYIRKINRGIIGIGTFRVGTEITAAEQIAAALKRQKTPFLGRTGDFERHYVLDGAGEIMPYRVYVPAAYSGSKPFPLIIALHGLGQTEDSMFDAYSNQVPQLAEKHGYLVAAPLGFRVDGFYGNPIVSPDDAQGRRNVEYSEQDVMNVLARMKTQYKVDDSRIYLMGHSMGAIGTWTIATKYPDIWAAISPFSGFGTPGSAARIRHIPQFVVHGDADPTVAVAGSRAMVEALKKENAEVTYIEVPGGNHTNVVVPNLPAMYEFFNAHKKTAKNMSSQ